VLIANRGREVDKPDTFVEEGALACNVSALRKAFGSDTDDSQFIATVPKRGYRFVAPVKRRRLLFRLIPPKPGAGWHKFPPYAWLRSIGPSATEVKRRTLRLHALSENTYWTGSPPAISKVPVTHRAVTGRERLCVLTRVPFF
jgi:hypothetical protein